ncbi:4'-phosphopantetheinyl transferase family protein [Gelidibacter mesophilus]|uniref:4'-phosphopantetheinyl transferase family protein n=1 Tax=Gelidibacter mesophilus TaxID=169050 RepID=UPI0003FBFD42|nr:4'-phosphopantetheinyl transferase superfamily protein [Gelidibacter mesophilus]
MYSKLFCGTFQPKTRNANERDVDDAVKIYKIELFQFEKTIIYLSDFLSPEERIRANGYHFEKTKNQFIICRILLKFLLAEHLKININLISIELDSLKKPFLASHPFVFFNVSHAGDYALIAISKNSIGIDIEFIDKKFVYNDILAHVFNRTEIDEIVTSNSEHLYFYRFWTRKEAIVKAIGKGIDDSLSEITVTDGSHSLPSTLIGGFKTINTFSFKVNADYIGAIAFTGELNAIDKIKLYPLPSPDELKTLLG